MLIPKVSCAGDVDLVATLLAQIEAAMELPRIGVSVLIETAPGMPGRRDRRGVPGADRGDGVRRRRLRRLVRSPRRRSAAPPRRTRSAPRTAPALGRPWHYPLARIAVACRAHGLRPIDGPYGDFGDPEGFHAAARRAAVLGYEGKWAIHPSQIELANGSSRPTRRPREARRIVAAMADAAREGRGAVSLDGRLVDAASLRMAEVLLTKLEQVEARDSARPALVARDDAGARAGST